MNKMICKSLMIGAAAFCMGGCHSLIQDANRSDLETELVPAKFKPTVEVMKDKGIVHGTATESYWFWFVDKESPETFAWETIDNSKTLIFRPSVKDAAVYDACKKSGASIILAPRFTVEESTGFLWFNGRTTVTVDGVPARITGAEEIPVADWPVLFGSRSGTQKLISVKTN